MMYDREICDVKENLKLFSVYAFKVTCDIHIFFNIKKLSFTFSINVSFTVNSLKFIMTSVFSDLPGYQKEIYHSDKMKDMKVHKSEIII